MPRRPGPSRDYYETYEMDREPREYRRHRDYEYDDYRRKSEPLVEDMARMGFRERPRREFMEGFERPIERDEMMPRRPREREREMEMEMEMESPERVPLGREDVYARPPRPRRRPRPREVEEDLASERASRRGSRRHPRDVEEDLFVEQRERHMNRRPRPDRDVEPDLFDEEERPRERRSRPRQMPDDEIIPDERERVDRMRRSVPDIEEEDFPIERERRRGVRRHPRDAEEDDFVFEEKEIRRGSRRHPERRSEEDLFEEDRERRRGSARHPERRSEDDLLYGKREKRHRRRRPERELEEDIVEEPRHMGRRRRPEDEIEEEEVFMRRREDEPPLRRGWDSERDMRAHERARALEDERYTRPRPRPPPGRRVEVEEEILPAEPPPDRHRMPVDPIDPSEGEFEEEMTTRWKGKGGRPAKIPEEEVTMRGRRERRRSSPSEDLTREMRGLRRDRRAEALDKGPGPHSSDSSSRARDIIVDEEEVVVRKPKKIEIPPSPPSPPIEPIRVPPIPKEVPFPPRHIDEYDEPRVPTPELRPLRGSPNKIEIPARRMRGGRSSEEDVILTRRDSEESLAPEDSISPTGQAVPEIFSDPWGDKKPVKPHARPKARIVESESESDESDSDSEPPFNPRGYPMPSMPPMPPMPPMPKMPSIPPMRDTKDTDAESTRTGNRTSKGTDDWSVVQSPPKPESVEMSGALNVVEVEPRHAPEPDTGRVAQQVTDAKDPRDDRWTEITKKLVVKDAIEQMGYEYEETRSCYFIFSYLTSDDIDELVELSDEIRSARRRRIRDMQRERSSYPPPAPPFRPPRMGMPGPPRARMAEKRMQDMRDRDWVYDRRR